MSKPCRPRHRPRALRGLCVVLIVACASNPTAAGEDPPVQPVRKNGPQALVAKLSQSPSASPSDKAPEDALVALGETALPALETALRLGLRGREAHAFIDSGTSKRAAVVRVLSRIPGKRSTDLLVRVLADRPQTYGMREATLRAVEKRDLSRKHLKALLTENPYPKSVLLALRKIGSAPTGHALRSLVERIHDPETAAKQLRNEHDYPNASARDLWELRLLSGRVLGKRMRPEMRQRAQSLVQELRAIVAERAAKTEPLSLRETVEWEWRVAASLQALQALGKPVQETVRGAATGATGMAGSVLDMARLVVGEASRLDSVATTLVDAADASLRHCAMTVLWRLKDPRSKPALWKALHDPLRRVAPGCLLPPWRDPRVYPIRELAARTLTKMGAEVAEVRRRSPGSGAK